MKRAAGRGVDTPRADPTDPADPADPTGHGGHGGPDEPSPAMRATMARIAELRGPGDRYALPFPAARAQLLAERRWWIEDGPPMAEVVDQTIATAGRDVPLRLYRPSPASARRAPIVYLHGGGWCVGSLQTHDAVMRHLARAADRPLLGIDYVLAPEAPFPAAQIEIDAVLARLAAAGTLAADWIIAGDSAGAHLALRAVLDARDAAEAHRATWPLPAAMLLFYGVYQPLRDSASVRRFGDGRFGLSRAALARYQQALLGDRDPSAVPRAFFAGEPLHGLPPTWLGAAALDPLLDDSVELAAALADAGAPHALAVYPGVIHGFLSYTRLLPAARNAIADAARFVAPAATGTVPSPAADAPRDGSVG